MKEFRNETFSQFFDRGDRLRIEDAAFHECLFENCSLSLTQDIAKMSEVRRMELTDCAMSIAPNFYASVEWALDIGKARFKEFDIRVFRTG